MFYNVENLSIQNLEIIHCSASFSQRKPAFFRSVIHSFGSSNVSLLGVKFVNISGISVTLVNTRGMVSIYNCMFSRKSHPRNQTGSGLYIEFTNEVESFGQYIIQNCTFHNNKNPMHHVETGKIGTLQILFNGITENRSITIQNCEFTDNGASGTGGAIAIKFNGYAKKNAIELRDSYLSRNIAYEGGGLNLAFSSMDAVDNYIKIKSVTFRNNSANFGGGVVVKSIQTNGPLNRIEFVSCHWHFNRAVDAGGAMVLYPIFFPEEKEDFLYGRYPIPFFKDVLFQENYIIPSKKESLPTSGKLGYTF